jgi:hypothetical protein
MPASRSSVPTATVISAVRQRTASFTLPTDAVRAQVEVLDADGGVVGAPVTAVGGGATVQLGEADGEYRVRITLFDAAGNTASVRSGMLTLDQAAPRAGGAPIVTGPGYALLPPVAGASR